MIELIDVTLNKGNFHLPKTSLLIPQGCCGAIIGAAGAGKTSLVEAICGLQPIASGQIKIRNEIVPSNRPMARSDIGYLPQDLVLFPHMTVAQNIAFGPRMHRWSPQAISNTVDSLAKELELVDLLYRKPNQLSGGQQKRVALARSVALEQDILCLDEPFVSLDEHSRSIVSRLLQRIVTTRSVTMLVVTHQLQWLEGISSLEFDMSKGQ